MKKNHYRIVASGRKSGYNGVAQFIFEDYLTIEQIVALKNNRSAAARWVERNCPECDEATGMFNESMLYD